MLRDIASQATTTSATATTSKRVSFKPTTTIVRFQDSVGADDRWTSTAERKQFVVNARNETKACIEKGCTSLLQGVFHDTSEAAQEKITACTQLPWDGGYCRGLEPYVCREHGLTRESFQKGALRTTMAEWKRRKASGMSHDDSWREVGDISRRLTSFATLFARRVGAADELAARHGEDPSKARKLLKDACIASEALQRACPGSPASTNTTVVSEKAPPSSTGTNKTLLVSRFLSQRSVIDVNGWCHGPRKSCSSYKFPGQPACQVNE